MVAPVGVVVSTTQAVNIKTRRELFGVLTTILESMPDRLKRVTSKQSDSLRLAVSDIQSAPSY
jgi:hypothetical protein